MTQKSPIFPLSVLRSAYRLGLQDATDRKPELVREHFKGEDWGPKQRIYLSGFRRGCVGRAVSAEETEATVKKACGCLQWERAPKVATDKELAEYLQANMSEGGGTGPGGISYNYKGAGLQIWASWVNCSPRTKAELLCSGMATVAIARRAYSIDVPHGQLSLF